MKKLPAALIILLCTCFSAVNAQSENQIKPPPPPPKVDISKFVPPGRETMEFLKKNQTIFHLSWKSSEQIIVHLKNGKTEKYNLGDENEKKLFVEKYGLPPMPPPPPPQKPKSVN